MKIIKILVIITLAGFTQLLFAQNVGIGTNSPTQKLDIDGQIRIRGGAPGAGKVLTSTADGTASWATPASGSKWALLNGNVYRASGNVGIGISTPALPLQIHSEQIATLLHITNEASGSLISDGLLIGIQYQDDAPVNRYNAMLGLENIPTYFGTNNTNRLTIAANGNVGIGTIEPLALLHTEGSGFGEGNVVFAGSFKSSTPGNPPISGAGTRMMWYPDRAIFRAGRVTGSQWDTQNMGSRSTAWGENTTASGTLATALGLNTIASSTLATAWGLSTTASAEWATAWGNNTVASGSIATAWGNFTNARSYAETVFGSYNTTYTPSSSGSWQANDRLFVIGNGTSGTNRSDAITVLKNGNLGVGTNSPRARLNVVDSMVLFEGPFSVSIPAPAYPNPSTGVFMMWLPQQGAFRVGRNALNAWNAENTGRYSFAAGATNKASGNTSTAFGESSEASGSISLSAGNRTIASGSYSTSIGWLGNATGTATLAAGISTLAESYGSTSIGRNNEGGGNPTSWVSTDPLFEIGNGASTASRSNAFTILKNGKTGILTATPDATLHINHLNATAGLMPNQGLRIQNTSGTNRFWTLYTFSSNGALALYSGIGDGVSVGNFNASTGAYTATSNRHLKTNVLLLGTDVLTKIQQLQPATYSYLRDPLNQRTVGFMAEDVQPIFPELVDTVGENGENLAINYAGFSVVAIKAIQLLEEKQQDQLQKQQTLEKEIREKEKRIETLENDLLEIKQLLNKMNNNE